MELRTFDFPHITCIVYMKKIRNPSEVIFKGKTSLYNTKHSRKKCKFRKKGQFFVVAIFSEKEKKT